MSSKLLMLPMKDGYVIYASSRFDIQKVVSRVSDLLDIEYG